MPKANRTVGDGHTAIAIGGQIIWYPTHSLISLQSKLKLQKNFFSFILYPLPLPHNKTLGLKGIFPLRLIAQQSTSIAYHLLLNPSVASAHPARGDPVSAQCTACIAVHSPHMSSPKVLCCRWLCHRVGSLAEFQEHVVGDPTLRFTLSTAGGWCWRKGSRSQMWHLVKVGHDCHTREFPFGVELDATLVSGSLLFHKALGC